MYNRFVATTIALLMTSVATAHSTVLDVGKHFLLPNQDNQFIDLFLVGEEAVRGLNIRAQIDDGDGPQPAFTGADFSGGIWDAHLNTVVGGTVGDGQFLQIGVAFDGLRETVIANGLGVRLAVSTLGVEQGTYTLQLSGTEIGEDSDLILVGGGTDELLITNGSITIVPEPGAAASVIASIVVLLTARRRRSR